MTVTNMNYHTEQKHHGHKMANLTHYLLSDRGYSAQVRCDVKSLKCTFITLLPYSVNLQLCLLNKGLTG